MKKLLLFFLAFMPITSLVYCQSDATISLSGISEHEDKIEITFSSDKSFIIGNNRYVLHVGAAHFLMSKHPGGDESKITFILGAEEFETVQDGAHIILVYGYYHSNTQIDGEGPVTEFSGMHWKIGAMDKSLLNR